MGLSILKKNGRASVGGVRSNGCEDVTFHKDFWPTACQTAAIVSLMGGVQGPARIVKARSAAAALARRRSSSDSGEGETKRVAMFA